MMYENIYKTLRNREYSSVTYFFRNNMKLLRLLISKRDIHENAFSDECTIESNYMLFYDGLNIFNNRMQKYCNVLSKRHPKQLSTKSVPSYTKYGKIKDCLFSQCSVEDISHIENLEQPHFYIISVNNWFLRVNSHTCAVDKEIYMTDSPKFKSIMWDIQEERLYLSATTVVNSKKEFTFALFLVWPLRFQGVFSISSHKIGHNIKEALLSENMLLITCSDNTVRLYGLFYDFQAVPVTNLTFEILPLIPSFETYCKMVFEAVAPWDFFTVGGSPWHYITFTSFSQSQYGVQCMRTKKYAGNGKLNVSNALLDPDKCFFYPDASGTIMKVSNEAVQVYKINSTGYDKLNNVTCSVDLLYALDYSERQIPDATHTSSGRAIKKRTFPGAITGNIHPKVQLVVCENDLDVIGVVTLANNIRGSLYTAAISFYDVTTGDCLTRFNFTETWDIHAEHDVKLDLDILYHCVISNSKHSLVIYRLAPD